MICRSLSYANNLSSYLNLCLPLCLVLSTTNSIAWRVICFCLFLMNCSNVTSCFSHNLSWQWPVCKCLCFCLVGVVSWAVVCLSKKALTLVWISDSPLPFYEGYLPSAEKSHSYFHEKKLLIFEKILQMHVLSFAYKNDSITLWRWIKIIHKSKWSLQFL